MKTNFIIIVISLLAISSGGAESRNPESDTGRLFIGTSGFVLVNLIPNQENPPDFFQLNFGYWVTGKDVLSLEAITWKYNSPLGIPYGPSYDDPAEAYPGYVREFGLGIAYQRFLWKGAYAATHMLPLYQIYVDTGTNTSQKGFELFLTLRVGYHFKVLKKRIFIEPSIACTYWPINANVPERFSVVEQKWPNFFLFEPGLHLGFKF